MTLEFKKAIIPGDLDALCKMDSRIFGEYPADLFHAETWQELETYWMLCDGERIGCSAFVHHSAHDGNPLPGSLYIMTTGVLPEFQGRGFGAKQKAWQIEYARQHGFSRIVTNTRKSNLRMISLNKKFGFQQIKVVPAFYEGPREPAIVMELHL